MAMLSRCFDPAAIGAGRYQGRGIVVCERWFLFANFAADMGPRPDGMTLDRIDNDGNYEPSNCRWADLFTQAQNTRRTRRVMLGGELVVQSVAARRLGLTDSTVLRRVRNGQPLTCDKLPTAKLNASQAREIHALLAAHSNVEIAARYSVTRQAISLIRRGKTWKQP